MSFVVIAAAFLLIAVLWAKLSPRISKQKRINELGDKIAGPASTPIIGNSLQIPSVDIEASHYFNSLTKEYVARGENAIRLWFAHVLCVFPLDGNAVKDILDNNDQIDKASDYDIMEPWLGDGLLLSTGEKWKRDRRMLTPTFHFAMLDTYVTAMNRNAKVLTEILDGNAGTGKPYDIFNLVKRCTLDIICETAMGFQLNSMLDDDNTYALAVARMGTLTVEYSFRPWLWNYYLRKLTGFQAEFESVLKTLKDFSMGVIRDRIRTRKEDGEFCESKRKAFLDMMLDIQESHSLSDEDIRKQVDTFMVAGHETTSTVVSWTVWALATHPEIQERVAREISDVLGPVSNVSVNEIKELHYLDMVLKESMRVNPPVPMVGRHITNDTNIGGHIVPAGANLYIAPIMIHRNERIYPDPTRFDPDRFLPENTRTRHAYDFVPFSAGPRNCLGQKFAMYEAKVILSWLISHFKFSTELSFKDNIGCPEIVYRPHIGIPVKIERRD